MRRRAKIGVAIFAEFGSGNVPNEPRRRHSQSW
jgi:hypothetical protein